VTDAAILDDPGEGSVAVVAAYGQSPRAEKDQPLAFNRADLDQSRGVLPDVELAIVEEREACRPAIRVASEKDRPAFAAP